MITWDRHPFISTKPCPIITWDGVVFNGEHLYVDHIYYMIHVRPFGLSVLRPYLYMLGHHHLVPLISISKVPSWSLSSPAWHHDLHHLDLYQCVVTWLSRQQLLLQLLLSHSDKVKQLFGTCILCNKETSTKHDHLIQQLISHHVLTISHHNMPCKNKLDVLYFVVASFTWLLRA